jgi:hypothetical protein
MSFSPPARHARSRSPRADARAAAWMRRPLRRRRHAVRPVGYEPGVPAEKLAGLSRSPKAHIMKRNLQLNWRDRCRDELLRIRRDLAQALGDSAATRGRLPHPTSGAQSVADRSTIPPPGVGCQGSSAEGQPASR